MAYDPLIAARSIKRVERDSRPYRCPATTQDEWEKHFAANPPRCDWKAKCPGCLGQGKYWQGRGTVRLMDAPRDGAKEYEAYPLVICPECNGTGYDALEGLPKYSTFGFAGGYLYNV